LLMVLAVRTVFGTPLVTAIGVVSVSWLALALQGYLVFLASPFVLYWAYVFLWGDVGDVTWSFGARQSFKRYLEASTVNPRDAGAQYQLGLVYQRRRQFTEALERFRKAVAIDANEIDAHYQLGRIARLQQRHVDAIRHFEDVVCRDERHSRYEIWREIGATYIEAGCFEHARWALEKYVAQREHDPEGLYLLGDVLRRLGRGETARQYFERCVESVDTTPSYRLYEVRRWRRLAGSALST
jgi:tetratricopeptide (TPR) repeat protein